MALQGFESVRAFSAEPQSSGALLEGVLGGNFARVFAEIWSAPA